ADWMESTIRPLATLPPPFQREIVTRAWRALGDAERLVFNKLITGEFRVGLSFTLMARAVAQAAARPEAIVVARLMGKWEPSAEGWTRIVAPPEAGGAEHAPLPFYLASPLEDPVESLGPREQWLAEWKWDGIRLQIVRRGGQTWLWTRGDELVTESFPELVAAATALPDDVVLDGEVLAMGEDGPRPFASLQLRLGRKKLSGGTLRDTPVGLTAFDLLEEDGVDLRGLPLRERRARLARLLERTPRVLRLSAAIEDPTWEALVLRREESRARGVEGLLLKRLDSPYGIGRKRGDWWK